MIRNRKKVPPKGALARTTAKPQDPLAKPGTENSSEQLQNEHAASLGNAMALVRQSLSIVKSKGIDMSLIEILNTERHWPAWIDKTGPRASDPPFNVSDITAEDSAQDNDTIRRVSFSYSGERYDFVSRVKKSDPGEYMPGTITLHENGERVICMEIVQIGTDNQGRDHFSFRGLSAFKFDTWIENIVRMAAEIKLQREKMYQETLAESGMTQSP
jgi:hypothetical protein